MGTGGALGLDHGRARDLELHVAVCWQTNARGARHPRYVPPPAPWYVATRVGSGKQAAAWSWRSGWIKQSFKDSKSRFGLKRVQARHRVVATAN